MKPGLRRVVLDTNTIISGVIRPLSVPADAIRRALLECSIFVSTETFSELQDVIFRSKFDRYFEGFGSTREQFIELYSAKAIWCEVSEIITDCRDPKGNKFLALAIAAKADCLVTGDGRDLLNMHPYNGVAIVSARDFLNCFRESSR